MKGISNDFYLVVEIIQQPDGDVLFDHRINGRVRGYKDKAVALRVRTLYENMWQGRVFKILEYKYNPDYFDVVDHEQNNKSSK